MSDRKEIELENEPGEPSSAPPQSRDDVEAGSMEDSPDLEERLRIAEDTIQQHFNSLLRAQAETENIRKRGYREVEQARKFALERFMVDMLEVSDSMERAQQAGNDEAVTVEQLKEGSELTFRLLKRVLEKHGLEEIDPLGQRFDPQLHEAISVMPSEEHEPDTVVQVVQKGFVLNERLIRAARVIVAAAAKA